MLYIFLVDNGTMMQFDMNLALEPVSYLKNIIARSTRIPVDKQILLISGGEALVDTERVCKYIAGTDTNPIFLFSLVSIESNNPPDIVSENEYETRDMDLKSKVENSLSLPDTQNTVAVRAALAQEYVESSKEQSRICETLIHDQHLQHQGWSAVVANLEDMTTSALKCFHRLDELYTKYLTDRDSYKDLIDAFDDDMAILHQIPVFPALLESSNSVSMVGSIVPGEPYSTEESVSLLEWISSRGSNQSLEQVADGCYRTLTHLDGDLLAKLRSSIMSSTELAKNTQMKEIGGLGDRLSQLEQLSMEAKRMVQEQTDLAKAFVQNQQRASNLRDKSILPDLCESHRQHLGVMSSNYQKVVCIRKRCSNAKRELSTNLHSRLKWIVYVQTKVNEEGEQVIINTRGLKLLTKKLAVIEQLHMAPSMFMTTAVEVVRRRAFANRYLKQTAELSIRFSDLYQTEVSLRQEFQDKMNNHFIYRMFPGLEDVPPPFGTKKPNTFDKDLPNITIKDLEYLKEKFPEFSSYLQVPNEDSSRRRKNRARSKMLASSDSDEDVLAAGNFVCRSVASHPNNIPTDCSSGVDPASSVNFSSSGGSASIKKSIAKEDLGQLRINVSSDLFEMKSSIAESKDAILSTISKFDSSLQLEIMEKDEKIRQLEASLEEIKRMKDQELQESIQRLTLEHELELDTCNEKTSSELRDQEKEVNKYLEEISRQKETIASLKLLLESSQNDRNKEIQSEKERIAASLESVFSEREKVAIKLAEQELSRTLKEEMEKTMEDFNLEKTQEIEELKSTYEDRIKRESENHSQNLVAELAKWKEKDKNHKIEMDKLITKSKNEVDVLRSRFKILQNSGAIDRSPSASESEMSLEIRKRLRRGSLGTIKPQSPKTELLENVRASIIAEYEANLQAERLKWENHCSKIINDHNEAMNELAAEKQVSFNEAFKEAIKGKDEEISSLKEEIDKMKSVELNKPIDLPPTSPDCQTSMMASMITSAKECFIVNVGDPVMIVWSEEHNQYTIPVKNSLAPLHILDAKSVDSLQLGSSKSATTAIVSKRDYCVTKKPSNRFKLPKGTKFVLVKCRPV